MNFQLINIHNAPSRNGYSMKADLIADGVHVCTMHDAGDGSQPSFNPKNKKLFADIESQLQALPPIFCPAYEMELHLDMALFIDLLHYAQETKAPFNLLS